MNTANGRPDPFAMMSDLGPTSLHTAQLRNIFDAITQFEDFDADDIEFLAQHMHCYRATPGQEIIREGDMGDFMILIITGTVEILRRDSRGAPELVATAGPGHVLGEMSLIDGELRFASCYALDVVEFAVMGREALSHLVTERPMVGVKLMMEFLIQLNSRLRQTSARLMELQGEKRAKY